MNKWNNMNYSDRFNFALSCGWAKRTANRIAKTNWEELSPAAQNVISRKMSA